MKPARSSRIALLSAAILFLSVMTAMVDAEPLYVPALNIPKVLEFTRQRV